MRTCKSCVHCVERGSLVGGLDKCLQGKRGGLTLTTSPICPCFKWQTPSNFTQINMHALLSPNGEEMVCFSEHGLNPDSINITKDFQNSISYKSKAEARLIYKQLRERGYKPHN